MEDPIRQRAYELWDAAGQPHGADQYFWFAAASELAAKPVKPKRKAGKPSIRKAA